MQVFEKYFKNLLKKYKKRFWDIRSLNTLGDFLVFFNGNPYFIELKNHKKFSFRGWSKKQPKQYKEFKTNKNYFLIVCKEAQNFKKVFIYTHGKEESFSLVFLDSYIKMFDNRLDK